MPKAQVLFGDLRFFHFTGKSEKEESTKEKSRLETTPIPKLMRKYTLPCVISLLVAALYNIVDQIFIANASYLGSNGNAANTVVFPLTVIALAVAVMIGDGCCTFVSLCLGRKQPKDASGSIGSAVLCCVSASLVLTACYLLFRDPLLTLFGGTVNEETFRLSKEYFFWITLGVPFYMFGQCLNPIIRSDGSPRFAMISTLAGAAVNLVLDPLFIFVFHWGMTGAAVATVLGQMLTAGLAVWYLAHMRTVRLERESFHFHPRLIRQYVPLGICSFLSQASLVAAMAAINSMTRKYGALDLVFGQPEYAQIPMAVIGIVMKFFQIVISISIGMAAGCIPIVGYHVGAAATLIVELFPQALIGFFGAANESVYYTQFAIKSFRVYLCLMTLATVNKAAFIFLQSMGKPWASTLLSMVREVVFGVGFALLLPRMFGLDGVLYSMPVSDALTFVISVCLILRTWRELKVDDSGRVYPA